MCSVTFTLRERDLMTFASHLLARSPTMRAGLQRAAVFYAILCPIVGGTISMLQNSVVPLGISVVFAPLVWWGYRSWYRSSYQRQVVRIAREGSNAALSGPCIIEAGAEWLRDRTAMTESAIRWLGLESVEETDTHVFLMLSPTSAHVIPRDTVNDGDLDRLAAVCRERMERAVPIETDHPPIAQTGIPRTEKV